MAAAVGKGYVPSLLKCAIGIEHSNCQDDAISRRYCSKEKGNNNRASTFSKTVETNLQLPRYLNSYVYIASEHLPRDKTPSEGYDICHGRIFFFKKLFWIFSIFCKINLAG
jgi:hypothetical protein